MVCIINKFIMKNKNWTIAFVEDEILISLALRAQLKKKIWRYTDIPSI